MVSLIKSFIKTNYPSINHKLRIIKLKLKNNKIDTAIVDVVSSCNAKCPFCSRNFMNKERDKIFINLENYIFILEKLRSIKVKNLKLYSTGEPTLHPELDKLIFIAKNMGFRIYISTNTSMLNKWKDALSEIDFLQFSIEGWSKETYERYRYPLKFEKTLQALEEFNEYMINKKKRVTRFINLLVNKDTDVKKFIEVWSKYVDKIIINPMYPMLSYENNYFKRKVSANINYFKLSKRRKYAFCSYPFNVLTIAPDGKIMVCCSDFFGKVDLGNILRDDIRDILRNKNRRIIQNQFINQSFNICSECHVIYEIDKDEFETFIYDQISSIDKQYLSKIEVNI